MLFRSDENLAVSEIDSKMVQDSSKSGPEVLNLRSLNFWRVHASLEIGCKMLCVWAFSLLSYSQRLRGLKSCPCLD